jgi:hypothetical protein
MAKTSFGLQNAVLERGKLLKHKNIIFFQTPT